MWRAVFGLTASALVIFSLARILRSIPVSNIDAFGLSGAFPPLFSMAMRHVFTGTGSLIFQTLAILTFAIAALWWVASSLGRIAVLQGLGARFGGGRALVGLHLVRALFASAAALAYMGIILFTMRTTGRDYHFAFSLAIVLITVLSLVWSSISWYLALAPVLAVRYGLGVVDSFTAATSLARSAAWQFTWIAFVFWCLRFVLFCFAISLFFSFAAVASQLVAPIAMVIALALAIIVYALFSYLLHAARLAAYVRVVDWSQSTTAIRS